MYMMYCIACTYACVCSLIYRVISNHFDVWHDSMPLSKSLSITYKTRQLVTRMAENKPALRNFQPGQ